MIWDSLFPWPFLIILVIGYLLFSGAAPNRIESLLRPFQSVKLFGQEFILNQWGRAQCRNSDSILQTKEAQTKFDHKVKKLKIAGMHKAVIDQYVNKVIPVNKDLRSTIHIPDTSI